MAFQCAAVGGIIGAKEDDAVEEVRVLSLAVVVVVDAIANYRFSGE